MLEVHCGDLGMACRATVKGRTREELVNKVAEHAARRHRVSELNATLIDYALGRAKGEPEPEAAR